MPGGVTGKAREGIPMSIFTCGKVVAQETAPYIESGNCEKFSKNIYFSARISCLMVS